MPASLRSARISPKVLLRDLVADTVLATATRVLSFALSWELDRPDTLAVEFRLAEAGSRTSAPSFISSLLAGGVPDTGSVVPTLLALSLDGDNPDGANYDGYKLVEKPARALGAGNLRVAEDGDSLYILYSGVGVDRSSYTNMALVDVLGAAAGAITPLAALATYGLQTGFIAAGGTGAVPMLGGLFQKKPAASTAWLGKARLVYTPCLDALVKDLAVNVDVYADYVAKAVDTICSRLGGKTIGGDSAIQSSRGHCVVDSSDAILNLSARADLYTAAAPGTSTAPGGQDRTVCIGRVGATPALSFVGDTASPVDETTTAAILDGATIESDFSAVIGEVRFEGGPSDAGFPGGYRITNIHTVNSVGVASTDWNYSLPIFSVYVSDQAGGLYYTIGDGLARLATPSIGCLDFAVDGNAGVIYLATAAGVYACAMDVLTSAAGVPSLKRVGGITGRVIKVQALGDGAGTVACHVKGSGKDIDGVYVTQVTATGTGVSQTYSAAPAVSGEASIPELGHAGWSRVAPGSTFGDFVIADAVSVFLLDLERPTDVERYNYQTGASVFTTLPGGARGRHLSRVHVTSPSSGDSLWVGTDDAAGLYYALLSGGALGAFVVGNDGTLILPDTGQNLVVYRVIAPNTTVNGVYVARMACTNNGLWWHELLPDGTHAATWRSACGENGLGGVPITSVAIGSVQAIAGQNVQRLHAINDTQFFYSNSFGNFWADLTRAKVDLGPFFSALAILLSGTGAPGVPGTGSPPANSVLTISAAVASATNLHLDPAQIPTDQQPLYLLPTGWQWSRHLDDHNNWVYACVNTGAARPDVLYHQFTDLQTNTLVPPVLASSELALVAKTALGQRSLPEVRLSLPSTFTRQDAMLRRLRPTDLVSVTYQGTLREVGGDGHSVVATAFVNLSSAPFYVIRHALARSEGAGAQVQTVTELSNVLRRSDLSLDDIAAGFAYDIKSVRVFGSR